MAELTSMNMLKVHEIHLHENPDKDDFLRISREIIFMNKSGSGVVVLDCRTSLAAYVQKITVSLEIPVEKFFWVMFDQTSYGYEEDGVSSVPLGMLKLQTPFALDDLMADAMQLINASFPSMQWLPNSGNASCVGSLRPWLDSGKLFKGMTNQVFHGKTGTVSFSSDGQRRITTYNILRMSHEDGRGKHWKRVGTAVNKKIYLESAFWEVNATYASTHVIKMVTSPDDPVVTVSKKELLPNEQCTLSQLCIEYVEKGIPGTNKTQFHEIRKCCIGFVIDILELLKKDLGIHVKLYFVQDKYYGAFNTTTMSWNGMIKDLIDGKAEIALTTLTLQESRCRVIDYSVPFLYGETKIMLGRKVKSYNTIEYGFLAPFDTNVWLVSLCVINFVLIVVWSLDRVSPYGHYQSHRGRMKHVFNIPACMSFVWSGVFKLELDNNASPRSVSARATSAVFAFAMLMLVSSYTANLAASLVTTATDEITNIKDKKFTDPSSGFKFGTVKSSSSEMIFSRSTDPVFQKIYQNMIPNQVESYPMAEEKLTTGALEAFIDDSPFMDFLASRQPECSFKIVGRPIKQHSYGFGFRKGSKWRKPISHLILNYKKRDYFHRLRKKWFGGVCADKQQTTMEAYQMAIKHFSGLFFSCGIAMAFCFALLIIEHFFYRFNRKILTTYTFDSSYNTSVRQMMHPAGSSMVRIHKLRHKQQTNKVKKTLSFTNFNEDTNGVNH